MIQLLTFARRDIIFIAISIKANMNLLVFETVILPSSIPLNFVFIQEVLKSFINEIKYGMKIFSTRKRNDYIYFDYFTLDRMCGDPHLPDLNGGIYDWPKEEMENNRSPFGTKVTYGCVPGAKFTNAKTPNQTHCLFFR